MENAAKPIVPNQEKQKRIAVRKKSNLKLAYSNPGPQTGVLVS